MKFSWPNHSKHLLTEHTQLPPKNDYSMENVANKNMHYSFKNVSKHNTWGPPHLPVAFAEYHKVVSFLASVSRCFRQICDLQENRVASLVHPVISADNIPKLETSQDGINKTENE